MSDRDTTPQPSPRCEPNGVTNGDLPRVGVQDYAALRDAAAKVTSVDEQQFCNAAVQLFIQSDCEHARMMLFDGGRNVQIKLCEQLALAHEAATKFLARAMGEYNTSEAARLANVAARLLSTYQQGAALLRDLQTGNNGITVQQVNQQVNVSGGNALVATNVSVGAGSRSTPCKVYISLGAAGRRRALERRVARRPSKVSVDAECMAETALARRGATETR